ncbi:MAG TPA: TonB-dependent receptor [Gammaproteobacteria bacterium]|nr:TonB-dependent receptor [Gammaproteobacteria bacterium]
MQRIAWLAGAACVLGGVSAAGAQSAPYLGAQGSGASSAEVTSGNQFNPKISVILEGNYYQDDADGEGSALPGMAEGIYHAHGGGDHGHAHGGHAHGGDEPGFNLKPTELFFSATVDPYFDAFVQAVITDGGGISLEEAYFTSRNLPAGLRLKGGKFLSGIGYHNEKHRHQWQFIEQNLPYQHLLGGHGLMDTGVQLTWTPATPFYTRLGVEALQGDQEKVGMFAGEEAIHGLEEDCSTSIEDPGTNDAQLVTDCAIAEGELDGFKDPDDGPRLFTAFAKVAPNLGYSHELQAGLFGVYATDHQEIHGGLANDPPVHVLSGESWVAGTDWVYAYDAPHQYGKGDLKLQAEYLYARKDLDVAYHATNQGAVGGKRDFSEDGFYVQGRYGVAANWRVGARYDMVGLTNKKETPTSTTHWDSSERVSANLTWTPSHFTRLSAQWSQANIATADGDETANQYYLRYILSMGQHGAHDF